MKLIDAKGLLCPQPIVELAKGIRELEQGEKLEIIASDPVFVPDLKAWCDLTGNKLISLEEGDEVKAIIEKV